MLTTVKKFLVLTLIRKKNKCILVSKDESFIYIPLLDKRIAKLIFRKPNCCDAEIFYDICDGDFFKDDRPFKEHEDILIIIIYHDALCAIRLAVVLQHPNT
jgi:hypothetical protein